MLKEWTKTFKCIYINCYNSLRFVPEINKKMQKGQNFWQFKDHNSKRRHENQTNDPISFICFSSPNCFGNSSFHLKIVKINFHGVLIFHDNPLALYGLQNTWILETKAVRFGFFFRLIQKIYTLRKVKKQVLLFLSSWEQNPKFSG